MLCFDRVLTVSYPVKTICRYNYHGQNSRLRRFNSNWRCRTSEAESSSFAPSIDAESVDKNAGGFCIIEGPETVQDFAKMEMQEIQDNIQSRRK